MLYKIQLFAGLADLIGNTEVLFASELPSLTVAQLKEELSILYPQAKHAIQQSFMAVDQRYATDSQSVTEGQELALIPPVSGGDGNAPHTEPDAVSMRTEDGRYELTYNPIEVEVVAGKISHTDHGASLVFIGTTREHTDGKRTLQLNYEAYIPMALQMLRSLGDEIASRWPGAKTAITHRLGAVHIGESSVVIAVSTPRRADCYEASRYAIERLKQVVPIWKQEIWEDGSAWIGHQLGPELWNPLDGDMP
ncbi:molybdenum cofactor biosynthesis protein [Paenibacillus taiwanensis]|uniref:molybdenum cofactor biosynthesis protein n=1 Tax=Paenibacillus taiwanensis TaxID=401638 RepID=UPI0003F5241E|nr:molybdenum cofactor biosynthesis protein MoaE [Paenibacillus taiwanensis]